MNKDTDFSFYVQQLCKLCYDKGKHCPFNGDKCVECAKSNINPVYVDAKNYIHFVRDFRNCGNVEKGSSLDYCEHQNVTNKYKHATINNGCSFAANDFEYNIWNWMKTKKKFKISEIFNEFIAPFVLKLRPTRDHTRIPKCVAPVVQYQQAIKAVPQTSEENEFLQQKEKNKIYFCWFCLRPVTSEHEVALHVNGNDHRQFYHADKIRRWYFKMPESKPVTVCKERTCECHSPHSDDECMEMKARLKFRYFNFKGSDPPEKNLEPWPINVECFMPMFPNNIECYKNPIKITVKLILNEWRVKYICMRDNESRPFFNLYNNQSNQKSPILSYESNSEEQSPSFQFDVEFQPLCSGTYIQTLEFEFSCCGKEYYSEKIIRVDVGTSEHLEKFIDTWKKYKPLLKRNLMIERISSSSTEESSILSEKLLRRVFRVVSNLGWLNVRVEPWNYCDWMTDMLVHEELEQQLLLSRLILTGNMKLADSFTSDAFIPAPIGRLFGTIEFKNENLRTREFIVRHINKVFITFKRTSGTIYECDLVDAYTYGTESRSIKKVTVCISKMAVEDLLLIKGVLCPDVTVLFRFNRMHFERRHTSLSKMPHYDSLTYTPLCCPSFTRLPFGDEQASVSFDSKLTLNSEQLRLPLLVLRRIEKEEIVLPFILNGAFGTGKSSIIAETVRNIICEVSKTARVLICTRSFSAGIVYLKMFQAFLSERMMEKIKMIRIFQKDVNFNFNKFLTNSNSLTIEMFEENRVFIKTIDGVSTAMSEIENHIDAGNPMFEYVFVDEASQVLEVDAIAVYQFGNKKTKFIFAGDAFQLRPDYFNQNLKKFSVPIVSRLHNLYKVCPDYEICLKKVYRSHPILVKYLSEAIYMGYGLTSEITPVYPSLKPMQFIDSNTDGENCEEYDDRYCSFTNDLEADMIVIGIQTLMRQSQSITISKEQILVCSPFYSQVKLIRSKLKKNNLKDLKAELPSNIQGGEFDAVFISTVLTVNNRHSISDLTFHSSRALINLVISRARHYVEVVGDKRCLLAQPCKEQWGKFIELCT